MSVLYCLLCLQAREPLPLLGLRRKQALFILELLFT